MIPKPGGRETRLLRIPTIRDRVVQTALRDVIEPIYERDFAEHSYGFRPGRGCKDGLRRVDTLLKAGYVYVVDADLKSYFARSLTTVCCNSSPRSSATAVCWH